MRTNEKRKATFLPVLYVEKTHTHTHMRISYKPVVLSFLHLKKYRGYHLSTSSVESESERD